MAGTTTKRKNVERTGQKMKICVIGGGFSGLLTAISIKKHYREYQVVMVDSDKEPKNSGFGESGPPDMIGWLCEALKIPEQFRDRWIADWLVETNSVIKYNFKWQNFLDTKDSGYFSGLPEMPSYLAMLDPGHVGIHTNKDIILPAHDDYMLYDIWYELYLQKRRTMQDFQPDINSFYYHCLEHTMPSYDGTMITGMASLHINSFEVGDWLRKRYLKIIDEVIVDTVSAVNRDPQGFITSLDFDSGNQITADFFIDCSGFKRVLAKHLELPWRTPTTEIQHNSTLIVSNGYTENIDREMHPYTIGYGMDYGWSFSIPLLNRKNTGYNFNSHDISWDQAFDELSIFSDPATRIADPIKLSWEPGVYQINADKNFALTGLSSVFVDPFDANTIGLQLRQIRRLVDYFKDLDKQKLHDLNEFTNTFADCVAERVEVHQGLAPRATSEYWHRNHDVARRKNLVDQAFAAMSNPYHTSRASQSGKQVPFLSHLYLSETVYFGVDMSRRCRQSSPELLNLAEKYFQSTNELNQQRAKLGISMRDWYQQHGIDINQYIAFRK